MTQEVTVVSSQFLLSQYKKTYTQIKELTSGITHRESLVEIAPGVNCLNWQVGHIVVARTNFLMMLEAPSIWGREEIFRFIPGSTPILDEKEAYPFSKLLNDLKKTQNQLQQVLAEVDLDRLTLIKEEKTIAEHLVYYAAHEAEHAGQIEVICRILDSNRI